MIQQLNDMFNDSEMVTRIQNKLPVLFHIADLECMRAGKIGMEVGTVREKIISAMLIYYFGESNIDTEIPSNERELDVKLFQKPISIKTRSMKGNSYSGVKLSWTVDAASAYAFAANYTPQYDIIFVMIKWGSKGALDYIPHEVQERVFNQLGSKTYFKLPVPGTNPRGVEISGSALRLLCNDPGTRTIIIDWIMPDVKVNVLERWVDFWEQD